MSLIHIASRTTKLEKEFLDAGLADCSRVLIEDTTRVEDFSIELTVGSNWSNRYDATNNAMFTIPEKGVDIAVGGSVVVEVAERIRMPHNIYGLIIPTGRLFLDQGIIIAAAKIEPSFNDRLKLRLVNVSGSRRELERGQKIASAIFFTTEKTFFQNEIRKGVVVATRPLGRRERFAKWRADNMQHITWVIAILALLASSATATVQVWTFLDKRAEVPTPADRTGDDNANGGETAAENATLVVNTAAGR